MSEIIKGSVNVKSFLIADGDNSTGLLAKTGNITATAGDVVITGATKGIVHTNSGTVTQGTSATTAVEVNTTSGVITTYAAALAATTNVEFTVNNTTVQADSVILVTMQDENTQDNKQLACSIHTVAAGSFIVSIVNPHSATSTSATSSKIHFLVINNS